MLLTLVRPRERPGLEIGLLDAAWRGVADLSGSTDPCRAAELERRIVPLATVSHEGGVRRQRPGRPSALVHVSWYARNTTREMSFWHDAQSLRVGRSVELLEKSGGAERTRGSINGMLVARYLSELVRACAGRRSAAAPTGALGPGTINPFIDWEPAEPRIYLCELVYRAHPDRWRPREVPRHRRGIAARHFRAGFAYYGRKTDRHGPRRAGSSSQAGSASGRRRMMGPMPIPARDRFPYWYNDGLQAAGDVEAPSACGSSCSNRTGPRSWRSFHHLRATSEGKYLEIETSPDIYRQPGGIYMTSAASSAALGYLPQTPGRTPRLPARTSSDEVNRGAAGNGTKRWVSWSMEHRATDDAAWLATRTDTDGGDRQRTIGRVPARFLEQRPFPSLCWLRSRLIVPVSSFPRQRLASPRRRRPRMAAGCCGWRPHWFRLPGFPQDGTWKSPVYRGP